MRSIGLVSLISLFIFFSTLSFATPGFLNNSCGVINESGTYIVNGANLSSQDGFNCINITVSNVLLNLNGSTIGGATASDNAALYLSGSSLTNITIANGTVNASDHGVYSVETFNVTLRNLTIYNVSTGTNLQDPGAGNFNLITNSTFYGCSICINAYASSNLILSNNSISGAINEAISLENLENITVTGNSIFNVSIALTMTNASRSTVSNNLLWNFSDPSYSILLRNNSNYNILANNTLSNGTAFGISITGGSYNNLTNNTIYSYVDPPGNTAATGIYLSGSTSLSQYNRLVSNTAHNLTYGVYLAENSSNTTLTSNSVYNISTAGFFAFDSSNNTLTNNSAFSITGAEAVSFMLVASSNLLYNNTVYNSSVGFYCAYACNITTFEGNNITNMSQIAIYLSDTFNEFSDAPSTLNFSGNNEIHSLQDGANDLYIANSTLSTNGYNVTTDYLNYRLTSASNLTTLTSTASTLDVSETDCFDLAQRCQLVSNIIQIAGLGSSNLGQLLAYYNSSLLATGMLESNIVFGRFIDGSGWQEIASPTRDETANSISQSSISSLGTFGAVGFATLTGSSSSSDSSNSSSRSSSIDTEIALPEANATLPEEPEIIEPMPPESTNTSSEEASDISATANDSAGAIVADEVPGVEPPEAATGTPIAETPAATTGPGAEAEPTSVPKVNSPGITLIPILVVVAAVVVIGALIYYFLVRGN